MSAHRFKTEKGDRLENRGGLKVYPPNQTAVLCSERQVHVNIIYFWSTWYGNKFRHFAHFCHFCRFGIFLTVEIVCFFPVFSPIWDHKWFGGTHFDPQFFELFFIILNHKWSEGTRFGPRFDGLFCAIFELQIKTTEPRPGEPMILGWTLSARRQIASFFSKISKSTSSQSEMIILHLQDLSFCVSAFWLTVNDWFSYPVWLGPTVFGQKIEHVISSFPNDICDFVDVFQVFG